jgi:hypothetical protein
MITDPVPDDTLPTWNQEDSSPTLMPKGHEKKYVKRNGKMRFVQGTDSKRESSKSATGGLRRRKRAGFHCEVHTSDPVLLCAFPLLFLNLLIC